MTNENDSVISERVNLAYRVFFEALKKDSLHELIRVAGEFWGYGVLLTDENYYLISQYPNRTIGEEVWDTLYMRKVLSSDIIRSFQDMYLMNSQKTYSPFYADWGLIGNFPRIFAEVYTEERILGHIGIFLMGRELQKDDLAIAQVLADALRIKMSHASGYVPSLSTYLSDLLRPDTNTHLKEWAAQSLGHSVAKDYAIMVTPVGDGAAQKAFAEYSVSQVSRVYRNAVSTMYEGAVVSLFGEMGDAFKQDKEADFLNQAAGFLTKLHAVSGISEPFTDLMQTRCHYQQAFLTSLLSRERSAFYRDYAPAQLFLYVARNAEARAFIHPALFQMNEYDKKNKTHYFETMRTYCLSMYNMDAASKALFVHRNTMAYRLNRISELFGIAFEDEQTARYLISSFELWAMYYT